MVTTPLSPFLCPPSLLPLPSLTCRLPVEISFTATQKGDCNFNLQCKVRRKPSLLVLNVKAEGYAISTSLSYTSPEGQEESLPVEQGAKRVIDFGQVCVCVYLCASIYTDSLNIPQAAQFCFMLIPPPSSSPGCGE